MTNLPYVTTSDGRKWSADAVENLKAEHEAIMRRRNVVELELAELRGQIRLLATEGD